MCGCRKAAPRAQKPPTQTRALPALPADAPIVNGTVLLRYLGGRPADDLANVPSGSSYMLSKDLVRVYSTDAPVLLERQSESGPVFERIN